MSFIGIVIRMSKTITYNVCFMLAWKISKHCKDVRHKQAKSDVYMLHSVTF